MSALRSLFVTDSKTDGHWHCAKGGSDVVKYRSKTAEGVVGKRRPKWVGGGENIPLDLLRILSDWVAILEARGVSGACGLFYSLLLSILF
jgi:hypothetical protein